jgi:hypothetical protein
LPIEQVALAQDEPHADNIVGRRCHRAAAVVAEPRTRVSALRAALTRLALTRSQRGTAADSSAVLAACRPKTSAVAAPPA